MDVGWAAVIQAILIACSTWYVRRGSTEDARRVARLAADQSTADDILVRVKSLESELAMVKRVIASNGTIDHRGPRRT